MTHEAKFVLLHLYSVFLDRIEDGETKSSASYFGCDQETHEKYFLGLDFQDYVDAVFELESKDLLTVGGGSNKFAEMILNREGIAYSEDVTDKNYKNLLKIIKELKDFIF
ncbi:hypothetical protein ACUW9N_000900 [Staphylococcus auricularis]|uniref:hypothetical protein n=1 Tax=Staphylococcus auricularis TaxID=29379 RepID=UPI001BB2DE23|nr:hypothetical protein [Staphylococcus auricularis]MCG7342205.1 hypothetical protein [Staphylococcus auricularis]BCU51785.1 hypothetical protein JCM2421_05570 [Staphylococcus auricularis]